MKRVDFYVGRATLGGIALAWLTLVVLMVALNYFSELRGAQGDYTASDAIWYVLLTLPRMAYETFEVAAVIGAILGVGALAANNELVAMRTAGISRLRLALAALLGGVVLLAPMMMVGEYLVPAAEQQARAFRLAEKVGQANIGGAGGFWLREGDDILNIRRTLLGSDSEANSARFSDVVIYEFGEDRRLDGIIRAERAVHRGDHWRLQNVVETKIGLDSARAHSRVTLDFPSRVDPALLGAAVSKPKYLSLASLTGFIDYLQSNDLDARAYSKAYWEKVFYPFSVLALILAGLPFVFGAGRSNNLGFRLFLGVSVAVVYLLSVRAVQNFGDAYALPTPVVMALPATLLTVVAISILRRGV